MVYNVCWSIVDVSTLSAVSGHMFMYFFPMCHARFSLYLFIWCTDVRQSDVDVSTLCAVSDHIIMIFLCLGVCVSVFFCLFICLFVCVFVFFLYVYLFVCLFCLVCFVFLFVCGLDNNCGITTKKK